MQKRITDLNDPIGDLDAANEKYVEKNVAIYQDKFDKRNYTVYIPSLEADEGTTGFVASASSTDTGRGYEAYKAFDGNIGENESMRTSWRTDQLGDSWLQIKCPEPLTVWRIALKADGSRGDLKIDIAAWNLSASNNGSTFTILLESTTSLPNGSSPPAHFNISTTTTYQFYRLTLSKSNVNVDVGIRYMQLYTLRINGSRGEPTRLIVFQIC